MTIKICHGRCTCCDEVDDEFVGKTTCHGIPRFCNDWSLPRRIFWFLLVVASITLLGTQIYDRTQAFLRFEMKTEITISVAESLPLPTITICNKNLFSRGLLTQIDYELLENVSKALANELRKLKLTDDSSDEAYEKWAEHLEKTREEYKIKEAEILQFYDEKNFTVDKWIERTGWQLDNKNHNSREHPAILECAVGHQGCSIENFTVVNSPYGLCYSFNHQVKNPWIQKIPGTDSGLTLVIDVDEDDYTGYTLDGLETTAFGSGLKIILHDWFEHVDSTLAAGVPTGTTSYIAARKTVRTTEDKPPWGRCNSLTEPGRLPYSGRNCLLACQTKFTLEKCGCRLWYEQGTVGKQCGVAETTACFWLKSEVDDIDDECIRSCIDSCKETTYQHGISYTKLISAHTVNELKRYLLELMNVDADDDDVWDETFIEQNIVLLQIGFSEMAVETTASTPAIPTSAFLSDIGGQFGLFAGISVITICELFEYSVVKIAAIWGGKRKREQPAGHDDDADNNRVPFVVVKSHERVTDV